MSKKGTIVMQFKTPQEIHQQNIGMNLSVEEIEAACKIARIAMSEALDQWSENQDSVSVKVYLSEAQWNVTKDIIASELQESGWEVWSQRLVQPNGAKSYIRVDIAPLIKDVSKRSIRAVRSLGTGIDWEKIERIYFGVGQVIMVGSVTIGILAMALPIMSKHLDEIDKIFDTEASVAPTAIVESES